VSRGSVTNLPLAISPPTLVPSPSTPTTEGVKHEPIRFGIKTVSPSLHIAHALFVVPKSIPITVIDKFSKLKKGGYLKPLGLYKKNYTSRP
jgi:hypothetical protein